MAMRSSTATSLLSRTLRLRATSSPPLLEPSAHRVPRAESRAASSSSGGGDPSGQEPAPAPMDSPIKVFSDLRGGGGRGGSAAIDACGSARKPLSLWPGMYHSPVTNALWEARSSIFERKMDAGGNADAGPQTELLTKKPAQSRTSIVYKFAADDILREQYRDPWNEVRVGKLLEDLDALAGTIAVKHCSDGDSTTRPLLLVTASVDKMVLMKPLRLDTEVKIIGAVTYVGRSSIDIQIEVTQVDQGSVDGDVQSDPIALTANFTFVARDSVTGKSAPVNRLSPETEREKQLYAETEALEKVKRRKREEQKGVLEKGVHKLGVEAERLKALLAEGRVFSDFPALADRDSILMKDTRLETSMICQPQQRNLYGRIFGGFLMHRAFELAFSTAYAFVGQRPCFLEVDHVDFLKPVDVGDFLRFKSCVLFTQLENKWQPLVNVEVVAHVTRPELRKSEISNTFHFTFSVGSDALKNGVNIRNVVPSTEEEARRILDRMDAEGLFD
uniref:HotDog ACOT-type domain-containing protein n=1 Tax=Aegilops tauschii subsp. strangulata TaxID=200361 RepID=A0A453LCI4_AEGTS